MQRVPSSVAEAGTRGVGHIAFVRWNRGDSPPMTDIRRQRPYRKQGKSAGARNRLPMARRGTPDLKKNVCPSDQKQSVMLQLPRCRTDRLPRYSYHHPHKPLGRIPTVKYLYKASSKLLLNSSEIQENVNDTRYAARLSPGGRLQATR